MRAAFTVYKTAACVQCKPTLRALDKLGAAYEVVDLDEDDVARAFVTLDLGYLQVPVVIAPDGSHWVGFRPDLIAAATACTCEHETIDAHGRHHALPPLAIATTLDHACPVHGDAANTTGDAA